MVTMYPAETEFPVYCRQCWWGDRWDPITYHREYDWQKPFFVQFHNLLNLVPRVSLVHYHENVDCEYTNFTASSRNAYLAYSTIESENVMYSYSVDKSKDCTDVLFLKNSELCYENIDGSDNYKSTRLLRSRDCINSHFLFYCVNCQDCFMSSNLRSGQFVFRNQQMSKEEYKRALGEVNFGSFETQRNLYKEYIEMAITALHKSANLVKAVNCSGDNVSTSKNVRASFSVYNSENVRYVVRGYNLKDVYDLYGTAGGELMYEGVVTGWGSANISFFTYVDKATDSFYVDWCTNSSHLFACVGLRNKQYCILNKQYTKEEYEALLPKIKKHMNDMPYVDAKGRKYTYGEFFPPELSPFAYNETIAQEYFPLTKQEATEKGYKWRDPDTKNYQITKKPEDLPDRIKDVPDSITNEIIECAHIRINPRTDLRESACQEQCTTAFKIIPQELQFYRQMNLPLPRLCPNCRHYERLKQRNPLKLWHRSCMCAGTHLQPTTNNKQQPDYQYQNTATHSHGTEPCPNKFETSYAPERPEIVYCETCYQQEVV